MASKRFEGAYISVLCKGYESDRLRDCVRQISLNRHAFVKMFGVGNVSCEGPQLSTGKIIRDSDGLFLVDGGRFTLAITLSMHDLHHPSSVPTPAQQLL